MQGPRRDSKEPALSLLGGIAIQPFTPRRLVALEAMDTAACFVWDNSAAGSW